MSGSEGLSANEIARALISMMAPEHKTLQSKAGYIDARPHIPQLEEVLLQRTAGPYIWVISRPNAVIRPRPLYPSKRTKSRHAGRFALCQERKPLINLMQAPDPSRRLRMIRRRYGHRRMQGDDRAAACEVLVWRSPTCLRKFCPVALLAQGSSPKSHRSRNKRLGCGSPASRQIQAQRFSTSLAWHPARRPQGWAGARKSYPLIPMPGKLGALAFRPLDRPTCRPQPTRLVAPHAPFPQPPCPDWAERKSREPSSQYQKC